MKLYTQHGFQDGDRSVQGLVDGHTDGVIFSPKDIRLERLSEKLAGLRDEAPSADLLFDPQYYACLLSPTNSRLGHLPTYNDYFVTRTRPYLERDTNVKRDLDAVLDFQQSLAVTGFLAPNIVVPRSLDSIEGAIAKKFVYAAGEYENTNADTRLVYATFACSTRAFSDRNEVAALVDEFATLDPRPSGFYLLLEAPSADARGEIFASSLLQNWFYFNYALRENGYQVINGYSDLVTPFLGAIGADAGATGWFSNLRMFTMGRFLPALGGGRMPIARYLTKLLLNRITYFELNNLRSWLPAVMNSLPTDEKYPLENGSEPSSRLDEILQSWNGLKSLCEDLKTGSIDENLNSCVAALSNAKAAYLEINRRSGIALDPRSRGDHLQPLFDGLKGFAEFAELDFPHQDF
jgi:hypothetical protein